jgi:hypothetical protein
MYAWLSSGGINIYGTHYRPEVHVIYVPVLAATPLALGGSAIAMEYLLSSAGGMILSGAATTGVVEITHIAPDPTGGIILSGTEHNYTIEYEGIVEEPALLELSGAAETYRDRFYTFGNGNIDDALLGMLGSYTLGPFGLGAVYVGTGGLVTDGAYTYGDFGLGFEWVPSGGGTLSGAAATYRDPIEYVGSGLAFALGGSAFERTPVEYYLIVNGIVYLSGAAATYRDPIEYIGDGQLLLSGVSSIDLEFDIEGLGSSAFFFSGSALWQRGGDWIGSEGATLSGASTTNSSSEYVYSASGSATLSGVAETKREPDYWEGSGIGTLSGSAVILLGAVYVGSGSIIISGASATQQGEIFGGSGPMTLSGAADTNYEISDPEGEYFGDGYYGEEYFV